MLQHGNQNAKGQASMISLALYSAIIVVGISTVVLVGTPILENMQDAQAVDAAKDMLTGMEDQVRDVANAGEGSQTEVGLRFARGEFQFDADRDSITYELQTDAEILSPHTSRQIGNLRLSSMAGVSVEESTVHGQPCWKIENEHLSTCIRKIPQNASNLIGTDTRGYWRFNENGGNTASDESSYENDGRITGARWGEGRQDSALQFDGQDDYVNVSDVTNTQTRSNFTVSAWVYAQKDCSSNRMEVVHPTAEWILRCEDRSSSGFGSPGNTFSPGIQLQLQIGGQWYNVNATLPTNEWVHVVGSYDNRTEKLYVNGDLKRAYSVSGPVDDSTRNHLYIGAHWAPANFFDGTVDEVRIYNRSLSKQEVQWLYKTQGILDYIDTEDLVLRYYNKDDDRELNASFGVKLRTDENVGFTNNGTGHVKPQLTGDGLGRGRVDAEVKSFFGIDYTVAFKLLSGSDFLQIDVED